MISFLLAASICTAKSLCAIQFMFPIQLPYASFVMTAECEYGAAVEKSESHFGLMTFYYRCRQKGEKRKDLIPL